MLYFILTLLFILHTAIAQPNLRGGEHKCNKRKLLEMAKNIKSPNTMYYVVSVLSLKTSSSPENIAKCLGFIWNSNLKENKYKINLVMHG